MKKFKPGAVRMALEGGVPILPVTVRGGQRVWPSSLNFPRLGHSVEIIYHPLFVIQQRENEDVRECARRETDRLAEIIGSALRSRDVPIALHLIQILSTRIISACSKPLLPRIDGVHTLT